jgi:energy-converting hydrogenase B subunit D
MFEQITLGVLCFISVVSAVFSVIARKTIGAIIAAGVISLLASIMFLIAAAPDVAMTEATIGAGLTTVIFLYALKHIRASKGGRDD